MVTIYECPHFVNQKCQLRIKRTIFGSKKKIILEIKQTNFENLKVISEIKRTKFGNQKVISEIKRAKFETEIKKSFQKSSGQDKNQKI